MAEYSPRANELFEQVVEVPPADRPAFLTHACGCDLTLRRQVEELLRGFDGLDDFRVSVSPDGSLSVPPLVGVETVGAVIAGRYKLLQRVGSGGMGSVWMADQTEPVKRRVAVKLIRGGRGDSREILARFEAERQAIALMDHPNIAKLFDAGATADGSPFIVMELVRGVPLTDFCEGHQLCLPDRLGVFVQICSAVQHAHQKGIIHRDLKPGNILVEEHDGRPVPKVIDFGLAKATSGLHLTEQTLFTAFGSVLGTPMYMAPEQAGLNAVDVDTRADIYALGVILYELLTGTTPLTRETIKKATLDEVLRLIREQEPPAPSTRRSQVQAAGGGSGRAKPPVAAPARELDWIVLKALAKDRDRRYETANGFAKDVERYLAYEPVQAGPPAAGYRVRKFVQRNKGRVIAAGVVLLALVGGMIGTTAGLLLATRERAEAEDARRREAEQRVAAEGNEARATAAADAERRAKEREAVHKAKAEKASDRMWAVLVSALFAPGPSQFDETTLTDEQKKLLGEMAVYFGECADGPAADEDERARAAEAAYNAGYAEYLLGHRPDALRWFEVSRDRFSSLAKEFPRTARFRSNLASSHTWVGYVYRGMNKTREAVAEYEQAVALYEQLAAEKPTSPDYLSKAASGYYLQSQVFLDADEWEESSIRCGKAITAAERLVADHPKEWKYRVLLGLVYVHMQNIEMMAKRFQNSLGWRAKGILTLAPLIESGSKLPATQVSSVKQKLGACHADGGSALFHLGKYTDAIDDFDRALECLPRSHGRWCTYRVVRASALAFDGQIDRAVAEMEDMSKGADPIHDQWLIFAAAYVEAGTRRPEKKREYGDRAMQMLRKAADMNTLDPAVLTGSTDLDWLRDRDDFKALVAELEKKTPPKREALPPQRKG